MESKYGLKKSPSNKVYKKEVECSANKKHKKKLNKKMMRK